MMMALKSTSSLFQNLLFRQFSLQGKRCFTGGAGVLPLMKKTIGNELAWGSGPLVIMKQHVSPNLFPPSSGLTKVITSAGLIGQSRSFHLLTNPSILTNKSNAFSPSSTALGVSVQSRNITKFSLRKGRRKTVKAVIRRFYRLDWGIWIRPKSGRHKKLWTKGRLRKKRLRQHVFCNAWHTKVLERMTTKYWHKKKHWVDDPYAPYHTRDSFRITQGIKDTSKHNLIR